MIIFSYFSSKPYVVTPQLNRLDETVQIRGHNIWFCAELTKVSLIVINYSLLSVYLSKYCVLHLKVCTIRRHHRRSGRLQLPNATETLSNLLKNLIEHLPPNYNGKHDFTSFPTVFQSYHDDESLIMKGCVQWNPLYG